eukprot:2060641-Lingulodinium_polyedra.AAC.1
MQLSKSIHGRQRDRYTICSARTPLGRGGTRETQGEDARIKQKGATQTPRERGRERSKSD